jgi:signal transduction histidine kinase
MIKRSLSSMLLSSPQLDIVTDLDLGDGPIVVDCEPLIEELFSNLFHNAVKFQGGPSGYVGVSVRKIKNGRFYEIRVSDKGYGIPDHMKKTIFSRLERSTERKHRGMGLTIVSVLVKRYGGTVFVEDRVPEDHKKGATFVVRLPASSIDSSYA